jgi:hypothetical protein
MAENPLEGGSGKPVNMLLARVQELSSGDVALQDAVAAHDARLPQTNVAAAN